jgi:hypothetical protein|tara:strand:+ start:1488 stop:1940 length:453 start_codon:yes stop_codon:yes gene_type:complete
MARPTVDQLGPVPKGLINLDKYVEDNFTLFGFSLEAVYDDIIIVEYSDLSETGDTIVRNGVHLPIHQIQKAWRIGRVVLHGPRAESVNVGDYVCFPNDKGIPVSNMNVSGKVIKDAVFLNEDRLFGKVKPITEDESKSRNTSKHTSGKRG